MKNKKVLAELKRIEQYMRKRSLEEYKSSQEKLESGRNDLDYEVGYESGFSSAYMSSADFISDLINDIEAGRAE